MTYTNVSIGLTWCSQTRGHWFNQSWRRSIMTNGTAKPQWVNSNYCSNSLKLNCSSYPLCLESTTCLMSYYLINFYFTRNVDKSAKRFHHRVQQYWRTTTVPEMILGIKNKPCWQQKPYFRYIWYITIVDWMHTHVFNINNEASEVIPYSPPRYIYHRRLIIHELYVLHFYWTLFPIWTLTMTFKHLWLSFCDSATFLPSAIKTLESLWNFDKKKQL